MLFVPLDFGGQRLQQLRSPNSQIASLRNPAEHRLVPAGRTTEAYGNLAPDTGEVFRILVVDRDLMSSDLLAGALGRHGNCDATAVHSSDLFRALAASQIDIVLISSEQNSTSRTGFDLAHAIGREYPNASVVILLNESTNDAVVNAFRCGARGVFSREQPVAELLDCVAHVRKGLIWAGRHETDALLHALRSIPAPNFTTGNDSPSLTDRELQVVRCAARGRTNRAIASELGLSEHTVKNYLFRAFEKLGVSSRVELLFYLTLRGHTFQSVNAGNDEADQSVE
jgi:two-component system, NarL family, nitrate/nitrite response regulator NarL